MPVTDSAGPPAFPDGLGVDPWQRRHVAGRRPCRVFAFPAEVTVAAATERCSAAVLAGRGWHRVAEARGSSRFRRPADRAEIRLVLAAVIPTILVAAGARTGQPWQPRWLAGLGAAAALRRLGRAATALGGREADPRRLPQLLATAQARQEWWVEAERWLREVDYLRRFRSCPRCGEAVPADVRWCPICEYEFTGADDHARDRGLLQWDQAVATTRRAMDLRTADLFHRPGEWRQPVPRVDVWWAAPGSPSTGFRTGRP
jgi:hypothetical protein